MMEVLRNISVGSMRGGIPSLSDNKASAPSLQMALDLLSDLTETVQDISDDYEAFLDRLQDSGELTEAEMLVNYFSCLWLG